MNDVVNPQFVDDDTDDDDDDVILSDDDDAGAAAGYVTYYVSTLPSLMYGLEACPQVKSDLLSLDFVVNRFFMKLFKTNNIDLKTSISRCQAR